MYLFLGVFEAILILFLIMPLVLIWPDSALLKLALHGECVLVIRDVCKTPGEFLQGEMDVWAAEYWILQLS